MKILFVISTLFAAGIASSITLAKINQNHSAIKSSSDSIINDTTTFGTSSVSSSSLGSSSSSPASDKPSTKDDLVNRALSLKSTSNNWIVKMESAGKTVIALLFINLSDEIDSTIASVIDLDENNSAELALIRSYSVVIDGVEIQLNTLVDKYIKSTEPSQLLARDQLLRKLIELKEQSRAQVTKFENDGRTVVAILFENVKRQIEKTLISISMLDDSREADRELLHSYSTVMEGLEAELKVLIEKYSGGDPKPKIDKNSLIMRALELKKIARTWQDNLTTAGKPKDASIFGNIVSELDTMVVSVSKLPDTNDAQTLTALGAYSKTIDQIKVQLDYFIKKYSALMGRINQYYWTEEDEKKKDGTEYYDSKDTLLASALKLSEFANKWVVKMETDGKTVIALLFINLQTEVKSTINIVIQLDENNSAEKALLASYAIVIDGLQLQMDTLTEKYRNGTAPSKLLGRDDLVAKAIALKSKAKEQVDKFEKEGQTVKAILFVNIQNQIEQAMTTLLTLDDTKVADKALLNSYSTVMEGLDAELAAVIKKYSNPTPPDPTPSERKNALINQGVLLKQKAQTWSDKLRGEGKDSDALLFDGIQKDIDNLIKTINELPNTDDSDNLEKLKKYGITMDSAKVELDSLIKRYSSNGPDNRHADRDDDENYYRSMATGKDALLNRALALKSTANGWVEKLEADGRTVVALLFLNLMDDIQLTEQEIAKLDESKPKDMTLLKSYSTVFDGIEVQLNVLVDKYGLHSTPCKVVARTELVAKGIQLKESALKEVNNYETKGNTVVAILFEKIAKQSDFATDTVRTLNEDQVSDRVMLRSYCFVMDGLEYELNAVIDKFSHSGPSPADHKNALKSRANQLKEKTTIWEHRLNEADKESDALLFKNIQTQIETVEANVRISSIDAKFGTYAKTLDAIELEIDALIDKFNKEAVWYVNSFYSVDLLDKKSLVARALLLKQTANKLARKFIEEKKSRTISLKFQLIVGECGTIVSKIKDTHESGMDIFISYKLTIDSIENELDRLIQQYVNLDQPIVSSYYAFTKFDTKETLLVEADKIKRAIEFEIDRMETLGNSKEALTKLNVFLQEIKFSFTKISNLTSSEALPYQIAIYKNKLQTYRKQLDELIHQYDHQQSTTPRSTSESVDIEMNDDYAFIKFDTKETLLAEAAQIKHAVEFEIDRMKTRENSKEALTKLNVLLQEINFAINKISNLVPTEALHNQIILYKHKLETYRKELDELIHQYDHQQSTPELTTESSMDIEMKALLVKAKQLKVIGEQEIAKQNSGKVYFQDVERKIIEAIGEIEKFNEKTEEMKQVLIRKYQTYLNELEVQLNTLIYRFDPK